jgi:hypothetical protein
MKLQPLKNFKYKYLFGDKIPKGDCDFSSHIHVDVFLLLPFIMYEMNRHSQDTWVVKLPWAKSVLGLNGKVV